MMRILLIVLLGMGAISVAAVGAVYTSVISFAQKNSPVANPNPPDGQVRAAEPAGAASAAQNRPQPKVVKQETYGDWVSTCLEAPQSKEVRCSIAQQLVDSTSKTPVFVWQIRQDGKGGLIASWQTPRSVLLNRGIAIDAGSPKPIVVPFETCGQRYCRAVGAISPEYIALLSKAEKATATFVLRNGKPATLQLSVKGLADGLVALQN